MKKTIDYKEALLELYLDSIEVEEDDIFADGAHYESQGQVLGSFRELEHQGKIILYVIAAKAEGGYLCYKASMFEDFAVPTDIIVPGLDGNYLVDPYNKFVLRPEELAASMLLFSLDLLDFMELEDALEALPAQAEDVFQDLSLASPDARFRIQEYELSLEFRSRTTPHQLWIPQLVFDFPSLKEKQYSFAAKEQDLLQAFKMLKQDKYAKKYYTPTHTLAVTEKGTLVLIPDKQFHNKACNIYCGAFKVFTGLPKKEFYVGKKLPYPLAEIQEILNIRIEPI
jgi:hypothetical protein